MIYFIGCSEANAVKIGVTARKPFVRLVQAQVYCPLELQMLAIDDGGYGAEAELHQRFAPARLRGEWFRLTEELNAHIAALPMPERVPRGWHSQKRNRALAT